MPPPRITMQDVARAAGVHQTTVSLALRNDPRLPEATRRRLRMLAAKLGYKPDPMLAALNAYRSSRRPALAPVTMAFLVNQRDASELTSSYPHAQFLAGAQSQAEQLGYQVEVFYVGHEGTTAAAARIARILRARGITGVILAAFADGIRGFGLPWDELSAVQIESRQLGLSLHTISNHQFLITRECVRRLVGLGYRRIGLAVGAREEERLQNAFSGGYHVGVSVHPDVARLPLCLLQHYTAAEIAPQLDSWVREHAIEVVVANWDLVPVALHAAGWRMPDRLVVAGLDLKPGRGVNAGMKQNHAIVGARAVDQLALLMKTNQRGLVATPNLTLIEGEWVEGSDVPPVRPARRGRGRSSASTKTRSA